MDRIEQAWDWIREKPAHWLLVAGVGIAAFATGTLLAVAIGSARDLGVGAAASTSAEASPGASESPASVEASASESPSASVSAVASAEPSLTPTPVPSAEGTPVPTPAEGHGGGAAPQTYDITGTWERLADMPGGPDFMTSDALWLPDGRIAVFRWDYGHEDPSAPEVVIYEPDADRWITVEFASDRPFVGTDQSFVLADDGFVHTYDYRIDISAAAWRVEPFALITESDVWAGTNLAADADGKVYRRAQDTSSSRTELVIHALAAGSSERSAPLAESFDLVFAVPGGQIALVNGDVELAIVSYDPVSDRWSSPIRTTTPGIDRWHLAFGPDGDFYAPAYYPEFPGLFAISPTDGRLRTVELPEDPGAFDVELLWDDGGRLYAFGYDEVWVFTPDR